MTLLWTFAATLATGAAVLAPPQQGLDLEIAPAATAARQPPAPQGRSLPQAPPADFRFGAPTATLAVRVSWVIAGEGSDVYRFNQQNLAIPEGAFNGPSIGGDLGISVTPKLDVVLGAEYSAVSIDSQTRAPGSTGSGPVTQTTQLKQVPVLVGVKYYILGRGTITDPFFWTPASIVPYVGSGGGVSWWRYTQGGGFVDLETSSVFPADLGAGGWAPTFYVFGGGDIAINPDWGVNVELRYSLASGDLEPDFIGFEPIDLSGLRLGVGANVRF